MPIIDEDAQQILESIIIYCLAQDTSLMPPYLIGEMFTTENNKKAFVFIKGRRDAGVREISWRDFVSADVKIANLTEYEDDWVPSVILQEKIELLRDRYVSAAEKNLYSMAGAGEIGREGLIEGLTALSSLDPVEPFGLLVKDIDSAMDEYDRSLGSETGTHINSGIWQLDQELFLNKGGLHIFAGRPGTGKSVLAYQIGINSACKNLDAGFISLEMTAAELSQRLFAYKLGIPQHKFKYLRLSSPERILIKELKKECFPLKFHSLYEKNDDLTMRYVESAVGTIKIDLLIIDYLQRIRHENSKLTEYERVTDISRRSKSIALKYNIPVILCVQMNREIERRGSNEPLLSDLRSSGQIEQDADTITFIIRDSKHNSKDKVATDLVIAKQRHGSTGTVKLSFDAESMCFRGL